MSRLYGERHRALQDRVCDAQAGGPGVEEAVVKTAIGKGDRAFIESRDMFFLSSIDHQGRPTVSYKGGDPGFVKVMDEHTVVFPSYDGNGMFFSMGNIAGNAEVGLLFIDFETPNRVRLQGRASVSADDALMAEYKEGRTDRAGGGCPKSGPTVPVMSIATGKWLRPRYVPRARRVTPRWRSGNASICSRMSCRPKIKAGRKRRAAPSPCRSGRKTPGPARARVPHPANIEIGKRSGS